MNKHLGLTVAVVAALGVVVLMFTSLMSWPSANRPVLPLTQQSPVTSGSEMKSYDAPEYGISFEYPSHYLLSEAEVGNGERAQYHIDLVEDTPENRNLKAGLSPGRDGPTSISFDIFQNNLDKTGLVEWVKGNSNSNFKLSLGTYEKTEVSGVPAVFYRHSGLYEANAFVFGHGGNIIKATVTYLSPDDPIVGDFSGVLSTVELY